MNLTIIKLPAGASEINMDGTKYRPDEDGNIAVGIADHAMRLTSPPFGYEVVGHTIDDGEEVSFKSRPEEFFAEDFPAIAELMTEHLTPIPPTRYEALVIIEAILGIRSGSPVIDAEKEPLTVLADAVAEQAKEEAAKDKGPSEIDLVKAQLTEMNIAFPPKAKLNVLKGILDTELSAKAAQEEAERAAALNGEQEA